jgi:ribosomal protein S18 acetylase RimI-like enzyme
VACRVVVWVQPCHPARLFDVNIKNAMIRRANLSDIPALARVQVASWQAAYRHLLPEEVLDTLAVEQFEANWQSNFRDAHRVNLVVEFEGEVSGFIAFGRSHDEDATEQTGEIYALYLLPALWGARYGRQLWEEASQSLSAQFSASTLWVLQDNTRARKFYERMGFEHDGHVKDWPMCGSQLPALRYRRNF